MSSEGPLELAALSKHTWPGLTSALSEVFVEAAAVCLHCHRPADEVVELFVECSTRTPAGYTLEMRRPAVTPQMLAAHRDLEEATERGATCIAALLAFRELGYELAERARKKAALTTG